MENHCSNSTHTNSSWAVRALVGMLLAGGVAAVTLVVTIETQVILLRRLAIELCRDWPHFDPEPWATTPRIQYRKLSLSLLLGLMLGAAASACWGASRLRRIAALLLILVVPTIYCVLGYSRYATDFAPSVSEELNPEKLRKFQEMMRQSREKNRQP